jgi:hypothetical protein
MWKRANPAMEISAGIPETPPRSAQRTQRRRVSIQFFHRFKRLQPLVKNPAVTAEIPRFVRDLEI